MKTILRFSVIAIAALAVASCAVFGGPRDKALRRTPSFKEGYSDGCAAATNIGADYRREPGVDPAYKNDRVYQAGYANGFQTCRRTISPPGSQPGNPIPEVSPGH
ncbi:MAG: hypothetical protein HY243_09830 [Proteobacteria bacterium]|nr:hypothetical protein [Pseudomonadota bacterium]